MAVRVNEDGEVCSLVHGALKEVLPVKSEFSGALAAKPAEG